MGAETQVDYRALARERFTGFNITGVGPWAVPSASTTLIVYLFDHPLLANAKAAEIGGKVFELKPIEIPHRNFRRIRMRDE